MTRAVLAALAAIALGAAPAAAEKPEQAGKPPGLGGGKKGQPVLVEPALRFSIRDRDVVRAYFVQEWGRGHCPPGLAKKDKTCVPRGLAKKRYGIGEPLPAAVVIAPLPIELARRVGPPPVGYRYGIVDGDLVKLALGTLLVVDAIDGLVE
jgi:hypothetical protein